jgi:Leucine-rich repeat (LRR) protein
MCTALRTVYFQKNELFDVVTEFFPPNLQHLNLASNRITTGLPIVWQDSIETLNLDHNSIPHTEFVEHWPINLQELSMDDTGIQVIPDNLPITLETLCLSGCNIHTIKHLPLFLRKLRANYNFIKKLEKLPRTLYYIDLSQNLIRSSALFKFALPPTLRVLQLDSNELTWIPSSWPETLETLDLSKNHLTEFRSKLPASLKLLLLNNNRITEFRPVWPSTQLQQCSVYIRNNCITENLLEYVREGKILSIYQADNWNKFTHHVYVKLIQYTFAKYMLKRGIRTWARVNKVYEELLAMAMHPSRLGQFEPLPEWSSK